MQRTLKRLRRSANDARDDDVLLARLSDLEGASQSELAPLIERVSEHRRASQEPIQRALKRARRRGFADRCDELVASVAWRDERPEPAFSDLATSRIAQVAEQFFDVAAGEVETAEGLHRLRIAGKQLRYSMEIFAGAYPGEFRESLYPRIEELQERLGAVNDHATAQARYQRWIAVLPPDGAAAQLASLITAEWDAFKAERRDFAAWWSADRVLELQAGLQVTSAV
jgi:CHAD domain-containing protein